MFSSDKMVEHVFNSIFLAGVLAAVIVLALFGTVLFVLWLALTA